MLRNTETRWFKAVVRKTGSIGRFVTKNFQLRVKITGSFWAMTDEAIELIAAQGYEINCIRAHSKNLETL